MEADQKHTQRHYSSTSGNFDVDGLDGENGAVEQWADAFAILRSGTRLQISRIPVRPRTKGLEVIARITLMVPALPENSIPRVFLRIWKIIRLELRQILLQKAHHIPIPREPIAQLARLVHRHRVVHWRRTKRRPCCHR